MRKSLLFILGLIIFPALVFALDLPEPKGFVNDYVGVLSSEGAAEIEGLLRRFEQETSNEISVAIVQNLQDTTVEDFAEKLFQKWRPGKEARDNGILFLISIGDRRARFEIGYGLEGAATDGTAGQVLDREVTPFFVQGKYDEGITQGVSAIIALTKGEYQPMSGRQTGGSADSIFGLLANGGFFVLMIFLSYLGSFLGRSKRIWPGGVIGAAGGAAAGYFMGALVGVLGFGVVFGVLGLLFDHIVSKNYTERKRRGLATDFWHSGGGFWLGGGRGGGFGGGGFGGFGGGGSGGGGASRGW